MPHATQSDSLAALAVLAKPLDFPGFLAILGPKDRLNAERHLAACEAEPDPRHASVWKRLACALMTMAPHQPKLNAQTSAQFYVPDGKYKMQVFALEDLRDGNVTVYCSDSLDDAAKAGVVSSKKKGMETVVTVKGTDDRLSVEPLDGKSPNPPAFVKDMLGWNRRALKMIVPVTATAAQIGAVEKICAVSVKKWLAARPATA